MDLKDIALNPASDKNKSFRQSCESVTLTLMKFGIEVEGGEIICIH